jgi:hypothetical protein
METFTKFVDTFQILLKSVTSQEELKCSCTHLEYNSLDIYGAKNN